MMSLVSKPAQPQASAPQGNRDQERYLPLVRRIAMKTVRSLPATITLDDILSVGWLGMANALRRRTADMNEEHFQAFASHHVRGAILDYLRSLDPLSRKLRGASRRITQAIADLSASLGRAPVSEEIASELGVTLDQYYSLLSQVSEVGLARLDVTGEVTEPPETSPEALTSTREMVDAIAVAIDELPERLRLVLGLYYQEDFSFREVGEALSLTESRACQLHAEAVHRIRSRIKFGGKPQSGNGT